MTGWATTILCTCNVAFYFTADIARSQARAMSEELDAMEPNRFLSSIAARLPPLEPEGELSQILGQPPGEDSTEKPGTAGASQAAGDQPGTSQSTNLSTEDDLEEEVNKVPETKMTSIILCHCTLWSPQKSRKLKLSKTAKTTIHFLQA